ncbi:MAG TPA: hypothetical protein VFL80_09295 [Thermoanaerobaculia bacterium]|nr:hypothetical protein [Thermoanaerobaculia bacterium]
MHKIVVMSIAAVLIFAAPAAAIIGYCTKATCCTASPDRIAPARSDDCCAVTMCEEAPAQDVTPPQLAGPDLQPTLHLDPVDSIAARTGFAGSSEPFVSPPSLQRRLSSLSILII